LGMLDRLKLTKKEVIIGIVLAIVIAFVLPPVGLMLALLAFFGLLVIGLLIVIFGPKNVSNLIIAWMATRTAEKVADKFSHGRRREDRGESGCGCSGGSCTYFEDYDDGDDRDYGEGGGQYSRRWRGLGKRAYTWAEIVDPLSLDPEGFENLCAELLRRLGYRDVRRVGGPGDRGVDIICLGRDDERIAVQCKRYSPDRKVSAREVREFIGALIINAYNGGIIITTSSLSEEALEEVRQYGNIMVIDGRVLRQMLRRR